MKKNQKNKRVLEIADELDILGHPEVASKLREAVTSGKSTSNEQSETNEGDENEDDGGIEVPKKPPPPQP